jgi:hypothetical protein
MEQTALRRNNYYVKKKPQGLKHRKYQQQKTKSNLGLLSEDEKKIVSDIRDSMREHNLKSFCSGFVGVHYRSYIAKEIPGMTASHARVLLKRLAKRRIIELKNAQKNPGYGFAVKLVNRSRRQNKKYIDEK